jgi:hypothetical protein
MRNIVLVGAFLLSQNLLAQSVSVVDAPIDHLFIPEGFDNNDNVEVVVTGKFPNPCYTRNKVEVDVKGDTIKIDVTSLAKDGQTAKMCENMKIPFHENITIGNLQAGDYKIVVNQGSEYELNDKIEVALSSSNSVDDHLYAQVEYVELGFTGGTSGDAVLVGNSVSSCLELDKVEYLSNKKDTLSVLPVMKKISNNCPEKKKRIEIPIKFDVNNLKSKKVMLFVRSIDGKSVHSFVDKD